MSVLAMTMALFFAALFLCWAARPRKNNEWHGEQAADMAGGLIIASAALGNLWQYFSGNDAVTLLLDALAWYAALPLLVTVRIIQAAQSLGYAWHWERMIWGRILLALCVIFELGRRANQLNLIVEITAVLGGVSLIVMAARSHLKPQIFVAAALWVAMTLGYFVYQANGIHWLLLPVCILIITKLNIRIFHQSRFN